MSDIATENVTSETGTKKYLVALWLQGEDPSGLEWGEVLPDGIELEATDIQEFQDVQHIAVVYITRQLTLDEWIDLGDKQDTAIFDVVGDGNAFVMAGPIPSE